VVEPLFKNQHKINDKLLIKNSSKNKNLMDAQNLEFKANIVKNNKPI